MKNHAIINNENISKQKSTSISIRLTISLTLTVALVSAITVFFIYQNMLNRSQMDLGKKADDTMEFLLGSLKLPLWDFNEQAIIAIGKVSSRAEEVVKLRINDQTGKTIYFLEKETHADLITRSGRVAHNNVLLGKVELFLTTQYLNEESNQILLFAVMISVLAIVSLIIVTGIFIRIFLKKPFLSLNQIVNDYSSGLYDAKGSYIPYDEFRPFGNVLTQMGKRINEQVTKLQKAEEKYRSIFENAVEGIFQVNLDGNFLGVNPSMAQILGYENPDELIDSFTENEKDPITESFRKLASRFSHVDVVSDFEDWIYRKDNTVIWISLNARAVKGIDNETIYIEGFLTDVTERKLAERSIQESEERFRSIYEQAAVGMAYSELDGKFILANGKFCEMLGYTIQELKTLSVNEITHPDFEIIERGYLNDLISKKIQNYTFEKKLFKKDGSEIWGRVTVSLSKFSDDMPDYPFAILEDISDRKKAEKALRDNEIRMRRLIEKNFDIIFNLDNTGIISSISHQSETVFGLIPEAMVGRPFRDFVAENDKTRLNALFIKAADSDDFGAIEFVGQKNDGNPVHLELRYIAEKDDNRVQGTFGVMRDVTERDKLQSQLEHAQKMESIGILAGGVAHDFNNLLMGIQGNVSLALSEMSSEDANYSQIKNIEDYVNNASELTKQLLGVARGGKYEIKTVDLNKIITKTSTMFGRTKKEITFHNKNQEDLWTVAVDQAQIEQVLLNLLVNAGQAMPQGGDIYISTENVILDLEYTSTFNAEPGKYVKTSVTDTGVGVDKEIQKKIFDPFFTTKESSRGTGLGLASAYGIIKNHGGIINLYSEPGSGTTFNIYLPASDEKPLEEEKTSDELREGTGSVLLIDDEEMILDVGQKMLQKLGYNVITSIGGKKAIEIYKKEKEQIDIVILDMIMPDFSGEQTFKELKTIDPEVKIILSSGYSINGQANKIISQGCVGFIQKPYKLLELSQKVANALGNTDQT